jgi:hypothetical protein
MFISRISWSWSEALSQPREQSLTMWFLSGWNPPPLIGSVCWEVHVWVLSHSPPSSTDSLKWVSF